MEPLDVFEHIGPYCIEYRVGRVIDALALEQAEEAFAGGVVATVTHRAHRAHQAIGRWVTLVVATSELAAAIRVQDERLGALALPDRHLHRPDHHLPILSMVHRPAHDPPVEQVQHDAQVQLAFAGLELGDVGDPFGFRLQRGEVPIQQVTHARERNHRAAALTTVLRTRLALQAVGRHQPGHPVQAGRLTCID